ncbi:MAG: dihydroorotate dehydrogenase-like protein [bacterium]|jgi:dihydroorotate dehydrogenase (fumarate)
MNLSTSYMGLELKNPFIVGSSRISGDKRSIRQCIDAGASAIVLKSIFEEQITLEAESKLRQFGMGDYYYWFPEAQEKVIGLSLEARLKKYLEFVGDIKAESDVPVISSINCVTPDKWPRFAAAIQDAGADALELNIAILPFDTSRNSLDIEKLYAEIVKAVVKEVTIPVSVKLGYYFTNLCHMAEELVQCGASGLVLFNRYLRPDIDIRNLHVIADDYLSKPEETNVPLRWIGLMTGKKLACDLVASTGVHSHEQAIKHLLVGASAVQLCSTLYIHGNHVIKELVEGLEKWMEQHRFRTLDDFRGKSLNYQTVEVSFERVQFMKRDFE